MRLAIGGLFVGHGTQKLYGWFGGSGLAGAGQAFEGLGMRPGRRHAIAAGVAETAGGVALAVGVATPLAAAALVGTMLTAINRVHLKAGPWASDGGYEYNLVLIVAVLALTESGPGKPSLDAALGREMSGTGWALAAAGAGVAGAVGAHLIAEATPASQESAPSRTPSTTPAPESGAPEAATPTPETPVPTPRTES
ncbi:MAG: DoxX family protein [Solirubrobacteraceae bacterium]